MSFREISYISTQREIAKTIERKHPEFYEMVMNATEYPDFATSFKNWLEDQTLKRRDENNHIFSTRAAIERLKTLLDNEGLKFEDSNRNYQEFESRPIYWMWQAIRQNDSHATTDFFEDMLNLLDQAFTSRESLVYSKEELITRMHELPKGTDSQVIEMRQKSKIRIIEGLVSIIENTHKPHSVFHFADGDTYEGKVEKVQLWWNDYRFHLRFAIRTIEQLELVTDHKLPKEILDNFRRGVEKGIPIFINPYYLSLIHIDELGKFHKSDRAVRDYVFYSNDLVDTFGKIRAWEKEDIIEEGKPNAAGWYLPKGDSVHRRYPEVAIFIPKGKGRACAGLCVSCQRMYGFQKGNLNFDLDKLDKTKHKEDGMKTILDYFENDSHLQDILITGGDAMMNTNANLEKILNEFYDMAVRKKQLSEAKEGERKAYIQRVRLGTRILAYLPQRVDDELVQILKEFKQKAAQIGIKQFVVQTHFETAMELTPEAVATLERVRQSGWLVVNQQVFIAASSRRAHSMQLRRELNKNGVLPYYTFGVKGFKENRENFAPIARLAQEVNEEKILGKSTLDRSPEFYNNPEFNNELFAKIEKEEGLPFIATDRSILNLPAMGKSLSFEQVGITMDGRRILSFEHDHNRNHSPKVDHNERVLIVESKSIAAYLRQLEDMGESKEDYASIYSYSKGKTEKRSEVFQYPKFDFNLNTEFNNCEY